MPSEQFKSPHVEITGGCMCGAVRYRLSCEPIYATMCHCSDCRRACGAQSVAWVTVPTADFPFTRGEPGQYASSPPVIRTFCTRCGTSLTYQTTQREGEIDLTTGSLDNPEAYPPRQDYYCLEKLSWVGFSTEKCIE